MCTYELLITHLPLISDTLDLPITNNKPGSVHLTGSTLSFYLYQALWAAEIESEREELRTKLGKNS